MKRSRYCAFEFGDPPTNSDVLPSFFLIVFFSFPVTFHPLNHADRRAWAPTVWDWGDNSHQPNVRRKNVCIDNTSDVKNIKFKY